VHRTHPLGFSVKVKLLNNHMPYFINLFTS
jgi:hypothetical protein